MSVHRNHEGIERQKKGISSIDRFDVNLVFKDLRLKQNQSFVDIGCGAGDYSIMASDIVGRKGLI